LARSLAREREPPLAPANRLPDTLLSPCRTRMTSEHVLRVTAGQSSTRSATGSALRRSAASVTRPAKDEILVMGRQVPSVRLDDAAGGIAPFHLTIIGLPYPWPGMLRRGIPGGPAARLTNGPLEEYQRLCYSRCT
jgi:hypothetical protein